MASRFLRPAGGVSWRTTAPPGSSPAPNGGLNQPRPSRTAPNFGICAASRGGTAIPADAIDWPMGLKPKSGVATKSSIARLKVADIQRQLDRRRINATGSKDELVARLMELLLEETSSATSGGGSNPAEVHGAAAESHAQGGSNHGQADGASKVHSNSAVLAASVSAAKPSSSGGGGDTAGPASPAGGRQAGSRSNGRLTLDPSVPGVVTHYDGAPVPALPAGYRGVGWGLYEAGLGEEATSSVLVANQGELSLTFLGTASYSPTSRRNLSALMLSRAKDVWLFNCGEDSQRRLQAAWHVRSSKLYRVFLTSLEAEASLGLPGLLCTLSSSRQRGHDKADIPVHVYGPKGAAAQLAGVLALSDTYMEMPILVHEFTARPVAPEDAVPQLFNRRARVWRVLVPPDHLNPNGFVDAALDTFMPTQGRATTSIGRNASMGPLSRDPRAAHRPLSYPSPQPAAAAAAAAGAAQQPLAPTEMCWTLAIDSAAKVTARALPAAQPTLGYLMEEASRVGALHVERCQALRVVPPERKKERGRHTRIHDRDDNGVDKDSYSQLKAGQTVLNEDGEAVLPAWVLGPDKPGRRVAVLGNTSDPSCMADLLRAGGTSQPGCKLDALVMGAVYDEATVAQHGAMLRAEGRGLSAQAAAAFATSVGAQSLILTNFDGRFVDAGSAPAAGQAAALAAAATGGTITASTQQQPMRGGDAFVQRLKDEVAAAGYKQDTVAAYDLYVHVFDKHNGPLEAPPDVPAGAAAARLSPPALS